MLQGLKRGDAADIWGGGLVQGGKLDEEVGNDGLPRVNMLKQWRMQQKGIIPKLFAFAFGIYMFDIILCFVCVSS